MRNLFIMIMAISIIFTASCNTKDTPPTSVPEIVPEQLINSDVVPSEIIYEEPSADSFETSIINENSKVPLYDLPIQPKSESSAIQQVEVPLEASSEVTMIKPEPKESTAKYSVILDESKTSSSLDEKIIEDELLRLINLERTNFSLNELSVEDSMRWAARMRSAEVIGKLSHTRPDNTPYYTAFDEAGYSYSAKWHGENISYMHFTSGMYDSKGAARRMFDELKSSSGHYQNMVSENFQLAGIGAYTVQDGELIKIASSQLFSSK